MEIRISRWMGNLNSKWILNALFSMANADVARLDIRIMSMLCVKELLCIGNDLQKSFHHLEVLIKLYKVKPYIFFHLILIVSLRCWFKQQNTCLDNTCTRSNAKLMIWNDKNSNIPRIIIMVKEKCHIPNTILHICKLPIFLFFKKSNPKPISFKLISFHQYIVHCMTNK
jgi:hypothetical protein